MHARSRARSSAAAASPPMRRPRAPVEPHHGQPPGHVHARAGRTAHAVLARVHLEQPGLPGGAGGDQQHVGDVAVEHVVRLAVEFPAAAGFAGLARHLAAVPVPGPGGPGQGRDGRPVGDRGQQPLAGRVVAGGEQGLRGQDRRAEHGGAGQVAAEFLHDDARLGGPGPGAAVALGDREPGHADLAAQPPPQRALVRLPAPAGPRTASRRSCCSLGQAHVTSRATHPGAVLGLAAPRRDERADLGQPQAEVVLGGVADRAVDLQRGPGRPVGGVGAGDLGGGDASRWPRSRGGRRVRSRRRPRRAAAGRTPARSPRRRAGA